MLTEIIEMGSRVQVVRELAMRDGGECDKFRLRQVDATTCLQFPHLLRGLKDFNKEIMYHIPIHDWHV